MRFAAPEILWALLAIPLLAALAAWAATARRRALLRFAGGAGNAARMAAEVSSHRRAVKVVCLLAALTCGIIAAARPQWGQGSETVVRKGVDLAILLDTSRSMAAEDAAPNRLGRAARAASLLIDRLGGDRVALVTFAGKPAVACPLTLDHEAVKLFLDAVDVEAVSVPGTALAEALAEAVRGLGPASADGSEARGRAILLLSDGEDHEGGLEGAAAALKRAGVVVFAIGCGSEQGAPIPDPESGSYRKDREGKVITTRLDERPLRTLALETGGRYFRATAAEGEIEAVTAALSEMDAAGSGTVLRTRWVERFQIPLALAIAALAIESLVGERRRAR